MPKSTALDDLDTHFVAENMRLSEPTGKFE